MFNFRGDADVYCSIRVTFIFVSTLLFSFYPNYLIPKRTWIKSVLSGCEKQLILILLCYFRLAYARNVAISYAEILISVLSSKYGRVGFLWMSHKYETISPPTGYGLINRTVLMLDLVVTLSRRSNYLSNKLYVGQANPFGKKSTCYKKHNNA